MHARTKTEVKNRKRYAYPLSVSNEWTYRGIEATVMESRDLRVVILHGKGTDITELFYKPVGLNLLFRNPWGPKSPRSFPNVSPHSSTFRDYTGGGWSDILPNAGDSCDFGGAHFGLHDETPLLAWSSRVEERSRERVAARFAVRLNKYPLSVSKLVTLDAQDRLSITETVRNDSRETLPFSWLVHPTFSSALVDESSSIELFASTISRVDEGVTNSWSFPRFVDYDGLERDVRSIPPADVSLDDTLVLSGITEGRYSITNPRLGLRFSLRWEKEVFPYLWYYRSLSAGGYPYYGRSRFVALEPCTSRTSGLAAQVRSGDARQLGAGESITTSMVASVSRLQG